MPLLGLGTQSRDKRQERWLDSSRRSTSMFYDAIESRFPFAMWNRNCSGGLPRQFTVEPSATAGDYCSVTTRRALATWDLDRGERANGSRTQSLGHRGRFCKNNSRSNELGQLELTANGTSEDAGSARASR